MVLVSDEVKEILLSLYLALPSMLSFSKMFCYNDKLYDMENICILYFFIFLFFGQKVTQYMLFLHCERKNKSMTKIKIYMVMMIHVYDVVERCFQLGHNCNVNIVSNLYKKYLRICICIWWTVFVGVFVFETFIKYIFVFVFETFIRPVFVFVFDQTYLTPALELNWITHWMTQAIIETTVSSRYIAVKYDGGEHLPITRVQVTK